ncbi:hypothetical protein HK101_011187, partial [Irineochytrium annulatum]
MTRPTTLGQPHPAATSFRAAASSSRPDAARTSLLGSALSSSPNPPTPTPRGPVRHLPALAAISQSLRIDQDNLVQSPGMLTPKPVDGPSPAKPLRIRPGRLMPDAALRTRSLPNDATSFRRWSAIVSRPEAREEGDEPIDTFASRAAKRKSVFAAARQVTRAQMRGVATLAAATTKGEGLDRVTPASALVELGGSGRVHAEEAEGSSTWQSILTTVNLLLGLGSLSLPYAVRCGGWIPTFGILIFTASVTGYSAYLLSRCLALQPGRLFNFADIGEAAFGPRYRTFISILFISELFFTCVAFVIFISDSLHALFPDISTAAFRVVAFFACAAASWVRQLKYVSYVGLIGIVASGNLAAAVLYYGMTKPERPGSLIDPEPTQMWPQNPISVSLSFGIIMTGFTGHALLPNIYLDMKDKTKFPLVIAVAFSTAVIFYILIASAGYLMFGEFTLDEVTKNLAMAGSS